MPLTSGDIWGVLLGLALCALGLSWAIGRLLRIANRNKNEKYRRRGVRRCAVHGYVGWVRCPDCEKEDERQYREWRP